MRDKIDSNSFSEDSTKLNDPTSIPTALTYVLFALGKLELSYPLWISVALEF